MAELTGNNDLKAWADSTMKGLDHNDTIKAWADITIKEWIARMAELDINKSGDLRESLKYFVHKNAGGDSTRVSFFFEYYGLFVDMGVGNGIAYGEHYNSNRAPKQWVNEVYRRNVERLKYLMLEKYAKNIVYSSVSLLKDEAYVAHAIEQKRRS